MDWNLYKIFNSNLKYPLKVILYYHMGFGLGWFKVQDSRDKKLGAEWDKNKSLNYSINSHISLALTLSKIK